MRCLEPRFVQRLWGREDLTPIFGSQPTRIGEVWFQASPDHPLLLKFLFTSQKLSVQVHPDDELAASLEGCRGKTEMWYVLDAEPGSQVALGLKDTLTADSLRQGLETPAGADLLNWIHVLPGDAFLIPAGTIHAIGAGMVICEIQQNSDVTYRLHDYGRGRELHLEKGLKAADLQLSGFRSKLPIKCRYFETEELWSDSEEPIELQADSFLIVLKGAGQFGDGLVLKPGVVIYADQATHQSVRPSAAIHFLRVKTQAR